MYGGTFSDYETRNAYYDRAHRWCHITLFNRIAYSQSKFQLVSIFSYLSHFKYRLLMHFQYICMERLQE